MEPNHSLEEYFGPNQVRGARRLEPVLGTEAPALPDEEATREYIRQQNYTPTPQTTTETPVRITSLPLEGESEKDAGFQ